MARCDRSAAVLVKHLRVPIVIGASSYDVPWRWRHLPVVLWPADLEEERRGGDRSINREFEKLILQAPEQYWLHDRYRGA
jgi:lauroyl/myristoyl acyltransferase